MKKRRCRKKILAQLREEFKHSTATTTWDINTYADDAQKLSRAQESHVANHIFTKFDTWFREKIRPLIEELEEKET